MKPSISASRVAAWLVCGLAWACGGDSAEGDASGSAASGTSSGPSSASVSASHTITISGTNGGPGGDSTMGGGPGGDDTSSNVGDEIYREDFALADGASWPSPWAPIGTAVLSSAIRDGQAEFSGATGNVARMALAGFSETNVDVAVTVTFSDWSQQGFGFYVRQNGGALQQTSPPGQGYAVYTEGGWQRSIGVWREIDGVEEHLLLVQEPIAGGLQPGVPYRIRFRCEQQGDVTVLHARIWPAGQAEPATWQVRWEDPTPQLQGEAGSFAVDVYNYQGTGSIAIDDIVISGI